MAAATSAGSPAVAVPLTPPTVDNGGDKAAQVQQLRQKGNIAFAKKNMLDAKIQKPHQKSSSSGVSPSKINYIKINQSLH